MRNTIALALILTAAPTMAQPPVPPAAPAQTAPYSVTTTSIGTLLDDPAAKAILDRHLPELSTNPHIDMARGLTLTGLKPFAPDKVTDQVLADIQADFDRLPAK